jgi:hypothetical protein
MPIERQEELIDMLFCIIPSLLHYHSTSQGPTAQQIRLSDWVKVERPFGCKRCSQDFL